jgi:hypothetical protein
LIFGRSYTDYIKARAADYRSVLGFFELMRREISARLATPCELAALSKDSRLAEIGFFDLLLQGESVGRAFSLISNKLLLSERDVDTVQSYFDGLGCGSLEGELRILDTAVAEISAREGAVREEISARVGLVRTLSVLFALGISILLL